MKAYKKYLILLPILILCAFMIFALSGCSKTSFDTTAQEFFAALIGQDFEKMQGLFTPQAAGRISLKELENQYKKVYNLLEVTDINIVQKDVLEEANRRIYTYDLVLSSASYGELTFESTLEVVQKADFCLVEWTPANIVPQMNWNDRIYKSTLKAKRGEIFDRNGRVLVKNGYAITVYADLTKITSLEETADSAAAALELKQEEVLAALSKAKVNGYDTAVIATYLPGELTVAQEEALREIKGIKIDRNSITPMRYAPYGSVAAHVIGYSTPVTQEDRQDERYANLSNGTRIGRTGIEKSRDDILRGTDGLEIYLLSDDSTRKTVLYRKDPQDGKDVVLTIDILLQKKAEEAMAQNYSPTNSSGSVTELDPKTGEVIVLASYPTYDLNIYATNIPKKEAENLIKPESNQPLFNRALQGRYPPGSIFKTMVSVMGLETGTVNTSTVFPYQNEIERVTSSTDGWRPKGSNWSHKIIRQHFARAEGLPLDMETALVWSDNIYFGWLGMELGKEQFLSWSDRLGFTTSIPFELPLAKSSVTNDPINLDNKKMLADSCFGQGEVVVTPLQLACAFSLFGNEGSIMAPYIVKSINTTDELGRSVPIEVTKPYTLYENLASPAYVRAINRMLEKTVNEGTGRNGRVSGLTVAGKTGTAQTGNNKNEIGWFAGYITDGGPNYVALIHLDGPKDETGPIKFSTVKEVFSSLKYED